MLGVIFVFSLCAFLFFIFRKDQVITCSSGVMMASYSKKCYLKAEESSIETVLFYLAYLSKKGDSFGKCSLDL